jgi:hypothetical protein
VKLVWIAFATIAAVAWLSAALHGFAALGHLSGRLTAMQMLFRGIEWFNAENYNPRGQVLQRRFMRSGLVFFLAIVATMIAAAGAA